MTKTYDKQGRRHSYNDKPAIEFYDGTKKWYRHGELHRQEVFSAIKIISL